MKYVVVGLILILIIVSQIARTTSLSPPGGVTGAPGELTCAQLDCHEGTLNSGPGDITFSIGTDTYLPGSLYPVYVEVEDLTKSRFGFEIIALDSNDQMAGSFTKGDNTSSPSGLGDRRYIGHLNASAVSQWQFIWTAPDTNIGDIRFYLACNAANGNKENTGDNIYSRQFLVAPQPVINGIRDHKKTRETVMIYPNPASQEFYLHFESIEESVVSVDLLSIDGRVIYTVLRDQKVNRGYRATISDLAVIPSGLYFVVIYGSQDHYVKKVFIE